MHNVFPVAVVLETFSPDGAVKCVCGCSVEAMLDWFQAHKAVLHGSLKAEL